MFEKGLKRNSEREASESRKYHSYDGEWTTLHGGNLFYSLVLFSALNETMLCVDNGEMGVGKNNNGSADGDSSGVGPGRDDW